MTRLKRIDLNKLKEKLEELEKKIDKLIEEKPWK